MFERSFKKNLKSSFKHWHMGITRYHSWLFLQSVYQITLSVCLSGSIFFWHVISPPSHSRLKLKLYTLIGSHDSRTGCRLAQLFEILGSLVINRRENSFLCFFSSKLFLPLPPPPGKWGTLSYSFCKYSTAWIKVNQLVNQLVVINQLCIIL